MVTFYISYSKMITKKCYNFWCGPICQRCFGVGLSHSLLFRRLDLKDDFFEKRIQECSSCYYLCKQITFGNLVFCWMQRWAIDPGMWGFLETWIASSWVHGIWLITFVEAINFDSSVHSLIRVEFEGFCFLEDHWQSSSTLYFLKLSFRQFISVHSWDFLKSTS